MSLLVYTTAWDRLGARKSGVGQKGEQKEKWRGGGKGSKERGRGGEEEGGVIISSPHVFIFSPLLSLAPTHSSHSITQALRTAKGTWEGLRFMADSARRASESYTDRCQCVWKYSDFGGARRDKRKRKRLRARITAEFAHYQTKPVLQA